MFQFALGPSDFSVCDAQGDELNEGRLRGVKVLYRFPWGTEALETLWTLGSSELLRSHPGNEAKLLVSDSVLPEYVFRSKYLLNLTKACIITDVFYVQDLYQRQWII